MRKLVNLGGSALAALAFAALATESTLAHRPITSKYTYNADVFPIVRDRCGRCHVAGGAAPMSLLSYKDAVPWAESLREELTAERMPPWYVDDESSPMRGGRSLTAREIDTIVTWATGGTPEGDAATRPAPVSVSTDWPAGRPDLVIAMDAGYTVPAETQDETHTFTLATGWRETRWVKAADLLPGTPSMVRDATIAVEDGPVLAAWVPSHETGGAPEGMAFRLPAGARLAVRIHYKKSWQDERIAKSDRSAIGLYVTGAPAPGHELREMVTSGSTVLADQTTIVAIRPELDRPYAAIDVHALLAGGGRVPLLRLRAPRPEWARRYWLASPVDLPRGSRIEVVTTAASTGAEAFPGDPGVSGRGAAAPAQPGAPRIRLDVVSR
jgi:hypothetical protein